MKKILRVFNNIQNKIVHIFNSGRLLGIFLVSTIFLSLLCVSLFNASGIRYIFLYPNLDTSNPNASKLKAEVRYLASKENKEEKILAFIAEFLLGPINPDLSPVFNTTTLLDSCILRGKNLYVAISEKSNATFSNTFNYRFSYDLFKKNVCTNFKNIDKIYVYVDGIAVFEDKTLVSESK